MQETPAAGLPPERLLQLIWLHQRILRDVLTTLDGRPLTVLHPGFWNREAGPDFREAVLQVGADSAVSGDVEVDLRPECWHEHRHAGNPAYARVRLHVVWEGRAPSGLPTLALRPVLDAPLAELESWLATEAAGRSLDARQAGSCAAPLRELTAGDREELLRQAARVRFERKADWFAARARSVGWDRALWEGLFGALGYKHNAWPMRRVGELACGLRAHAPSGSERACHLQAVLLGVAGFLPCEPPRTAGAGSYWRRLWDVWWRERAVLDPHRLPRTVWRLNGIRPANHPQRRLALAAHWLAGEDLPKRVANWLQRDVPDRALAPSLLGVLQVEDDGFWSRHWTLQSREQTEPQPLLGEARCADLAVNVVLPWLSSRAREGADGALQARIEHRYFGWPTGEDNVVLKLARRRLLGMASFRLPPRAAMQQGLLQIVRDFCDHSNAVCEGCRFPGLVRTLVRSAPPSGGPTEPTSAGERSA